MSDWRDWHQRGLALHEMARYAEAAEAYRRAIALRPDFGATFNNLGNALREMGDVDAAMEALREAARLLPKSVEVKANLASTLRELGLVDEAIALYREALAIRPDFDECRSNLIFSMQFSSDVTPEAIAAEQRFYDERHRQAVRPHENARDPERRLKIGYVSPDFRGHPVAKFILPALAQRDRERFEVFCYSDALAEDEWTGRVRGQSDVFRATGGLSHEALAEQVRSDEIDVLVDLALHSADNRLAAFALKPAPVQVSHLGYPGGTGLSAIDAHISDPFLQPNNDGPKLTSYWCYTAPEQAPEVVDPPVCRGEPITFGCLNSFAKVSDACLSAWARLLARASGSRMILYCPAGSAAERVQEALKPARVLCLGRSGFSEYLASYGAIDIALDPFPCAGGTTTCDALWMGVPVVTLAGCLPAHRSGASILSQIGLSPLIASDVSGYIDAASRLAGDPALLRTLRHTMRGRLVRSPLMDANGFARELEAIYRRLWRAFCASSH